MAEDDGTVVHMPGQEPLDNTDYTKVKFLGVSMDALDEEFKIGDEAEFIVRARCKGIGEDEMADGHTREFAKMKVSSVKLKRRIEPKAEGADE